MSFIEYFKLLFPDQMPQKDWTRTFTSKEPLLSSVLYVLYVLLCNPALESEPDKQDSWPGDFKV